MTKGDWVAKPTFKAVYDSNNDANTLTFYYDADEHSGDGITVYKDGTDKYLFDDSKKEGQKWGYNSVRSNIKSVVIDASVADYSYLTSTAYMFYSMRNASNISGIQYLDVSNVADMSSMFRSYGYYATALTDVPDVSKWNTGNVTNMSQLFYGYGYNSATLSDVPDVSKWNTGNVTNMFQMFNTYGYNSTAITKAPDVREWNTGNVTDMSEMFNCYGYNKSTILTGVPDVSKWDTGNVKDMSDMFRNYGYKSTILTGVPDVSKWDTGNVKDMSSMFESYGYKSTAITGVPDVSEWNTGNVTDMSSMFNGYGGNSTGLTAVPNVSKWNTSNVTNMYGVFFNYGLKSTVITNVPDVSKWNTDNVTDMSSMFKAYGSSSPALTKVPDVSGWNMSNVTTIFNMFSFYGKKDAVDFVLDLSGWNIIKVTEAGNAFNVSTPKTFSVTIPAKTGDIDNDETHWYGSSNDVFAPPVYGHEFILEGTYAVSFDLNGQSGTTPQTRYVCSGKKVTKPSPDPTTDGYAFGGWYKEPECINVWNFDTDTVSGEMTLYAKWIEVMTVKDILTTVEGGFPEAETTTAPDNAWTSSAGGKCFVYQTNLLFYDGSVAAGLNLTGYALKENDGYAMTTEEGETIIFNMTGGKLTSIDFDGKSGNYAAMTGSYAPTI